MRGNQRQPWPATPGLQVREILVFIGTCSVTTAPLSAFEGGSGSWIASLGSLTEHSRQGDTLFEDHTGPAAINNREEKEEEEEEEESLSSSSSSEEEEEGLFKANAVN